MRVTITCEDCGHRHRLERPLSEPQAIWIVCHECELPLQAVLDTTPQLRSPRPLSADVWADVLSLSPEQPSR